jgi:hypothetical protein
MAAQVSAYSSPAHVPEKWESNRKGEIDGRQPAGNSLGYQGPDQGFVLKIAAGLRGEVKVQAGESVDDAIRGSINIALKRASLYGRAPVVHDLRLALIIWGWFDAAPLADLVAVRRDLFAGVSHVTAHYTEGRHIADLVPESTLRMTPDQAKAAMPASWRALTGA